MMGRLATATGPTGNKKRLAALLGVVTARAWWQGLLGLGRQPTTDGVAGMLKVEGGLHRAVGAGQLVKLGHKLIKVGIRAVPAEPYARSLISGFPFNIIRRASTFILDAVVALVRLQMQVVPISYLGRDALGEGGAIGAFGLLGAIGLEHTQQEFTSTV
jgi:hypothetical protein